MATYTITTEQIAEIIAASLDMATPEGSEQNEHDAIRDVGYRIAEQLEIANQGFDRAAFLKAIGVTP